MDTQAINQAAVTAGQVGLLTWLVVAIALFGGLVVLLVLWQNAKREERYATLVEVHIASLNTKIDAHGNRIDMYKDVVKEKMAGIEEANRLTKQEHSLMITNLTKISATMVELAYIVKGICKHTPHEPTK